MFQGLINSAKTAASSLIINYIARASVAVPFVIALGFVLAALAAMLIDRFGHIAGYWLMAGGLVAIGASIDGGRPLELRIGVKPPCHVFGRGDKSERLGRKTGRPVLRGLKKLLGLPNVVGADHRDKGRQPFRPFIVGAASGLDLVER